MDDTNFEQLSDTFEATVNVGRRPLAAISHNQSSRRSNVAVAASTDNSSSAAKEGGNRPLPAILMRKRKMALLPAVRDRLSSSSTATSAAMEVSVSPILHRDTDENCDPKDVEVYDESESDSGGSSCDVEEDSEDEDIDVVNVSSNACNLSSFALLQDENETTHLITDSSVLADVDGHHADDDMAAPVKPASALLSVHNSLNLTLPDDSEATVPRSVRLTSALPSSASSRRRIRLSSPVNRQRLLAKSDHSKSPSPSKGRERPATTVCDSPSWLKKIKLRRSWTQFREYVHHVTPIDVAGEPPIRCRSDGLCPLPELNWADRNQVWNLLCIKESGMYERLDERSLLDRHPHLQPNMRSILLDWMMVVCEVYRMNRQTFYLAIDYIDRYLTLARDIPKTSLQLIGVTCLFVAAKIEEIFPPKLNDFAYVTDKACSEKDILAMELVIMKTLNWGLAPMTPHAWIKLYLQTWAASATSDCEPDSVEAHDEQEEEEEMLIIKCLPSSLSDDTSFFTAKYSPQIYTEVMQLVDLATLDMDSLSHSYSVLATSALALTTGDLDMALTVAGYEVESVQDCLNWMMAHHEVLDGERSAVITARAEVKSFADVPICNQHLIQAHTVDVPLLDEARSKVEERRKLAEDQALAETLLLQQQQQRHRLSHLSPDTNGSANMLRPEWSINEMTPPTDGHLHSSSLASAGKRGANYSSYAEAAMAKASMTPRSAGSSAGQSHQHLSSIFMSPSSPPLSVSGASGRGRGGSNNSSLRPTVEGIRCTRAVDS